MKTLLIIGAGGHGQVVKEIAEDLGYEKIAFLDDNSPIAIGKISDIDKFKEEYQDAFVGIGNNAFRDKLIEQLEKAGYNVPVLVHPSAYISRTAFIGAGTVIEPKAIVNAHASIGKGCIISVGSIVDHDTMLGNCVHANAGSIVKAGGTVEAFDKLEAGQVALGYPSAVVMAKADSNSDFAKEEESKTGKPVSFF